VRERVQGTAVAFVDNWFDARLPELQYWSIDRLHLNARGHAIAAANVLATLAVPIAGAAQASAIPDETDNLHRPRTAEYWLSYVLPWIGRRLTGRSSGDHRQAKRAALEPFGPEQA